MCFSIACSMFFGSFQHLFTCLSSRSSLLFQTLSFFLTLFFFFFEPFFFEKAVVLASDFCLGKEQHMNPSCRCLFGSTPSRFMSGFVTHHVLFRHIEVRAPDLNRGRPVETKA